MVLIHFGDCGRIVEVAYFLNEGVIAAVSAGEEGKEPESCSLHGGLSIVRMEEEFNDVGGFPLLLPSHEFHSSIPDGPDPLWDHHLAFCCWDSSSDSSLIMFKAIGNAEDSQLSLQLSVVSIVLGVESFELFDPSCCLFELLDIVFSPLGDCGGEPEGSGSDGGIECGVEGEDSFC